MTPNMLSKNDYIQSYENAVTALRKTPGNQDTQHKAVLALARAGSLDFAISEYKRYGLNKVRHHEDIMALGGRLHKDLYMTSSGATALQHAKDSAAQYEAAFQDSQGYYSGVNAATMALLADMPDYIVRERVSAILNILPQTDRLSKEDHYFIEATRAECFLLLGETKKAELAFRCAIEFDPLNYTAHASTLKQFGLILDKRNTSKAWLDNLKPPRPVHFAGHLWPHSNTSSEQLSNQLSDVIQQHDIGFGYGALAAGADITIAEALLAEGAELNVFLPSPIDDFLEYSVRPFGEGWVPRFKACLERAQSCIELPQKQGGVSAKQNILSAQMAMGQAILRSSYLDVAPCQLLISDSSRKGSFTSRHSEDWTALGLEQLNINLPQGIKLSDVEAIKPLNLSVLVGNSTAVSFQKFSNFETAISDIIDNQMDSSVTASLHFNLPGAENTLETIMNKNLHGTILISEAMAGYIALKHRTDFKVVFAGTALDKTEAPIRCYTLQPLF